MCLKKLLSLLLAVIFCLCCFVFSASADVGLENWSDDYFGYGVVSAYESDTKILDKELLSPAFSDRPVDSFYVPRWSYYTPVFSSSWTSSGTDNVGFYSSYVCADTPVFTSCSLYFAVGCFSSKSKPESVSDYINVVNSQVIPYSFCNRGYWDNEISMQFGTVHYLSTINGGSGLSQLSSLGYYGSRIIFMRVDYSSPVTDTSLDRCFTAFRLACPATLWQYSYVTGTKWGYFVPCFFIVVDDAYSDAIKGILEHVASIDDELLTYLPQIYSSLQSVVSQLQALNTDTDTIITILNQILAWDSKIWTQLYNISNSVDAIYYVLTEELKDESDELSSAASAAVDQISNEQEASTYYQTSMQNSYDSLALDDLSFGAHSSGIELVGDIFSDILDAFGSAAIIFTFPLVLGIALLAIGRISKSHITSSSSKDGDSGDD